MRCKKYNGFTQMQTLSIMGVVILIIFASLAVPFYNNCMQKQTVSKLKLLYTSLEQANRMYTLANHDDADEYDMNMSAEEFAETYFTPYLQVNSSCKKDQSACWKNPQYTDLAKNKIYNKSQYSLVLNRKVVLGFHKDEKNGLINIIADIDGKSGENRLGRDVFIFSFYNSSSPVNLCDEGVYKERSIKSGIHFGGYDECGIPHDVYTYSDLYSSSLKDSCNKKAAASENGLGIGAACLALINKSAWAIDKIYPW